jgi:hypothetical protein
MTRVCRGTPRSFDLGRGDDARLSCPRAADPSSGRVHLTEMIGGACNLSRALAVRPRGCIVLSGFTWKRMPCGRERHERMMARLSTNSDEEVEPTSFGGLSSVVVEASLSLVELRLSKRLLGPQAQAHYSMRAGAHRLRVQHCSSPQQRPQQKFSARYCPVTRVTHGYSCDRRWAWDR